MSVVFFFFKQKTAYEMRISDWSSDVCSSDLKLRISSSRHRTARSRAIRNHRRRKIHQTNHRTARRKLRHRTVHRIRSRTPSQPRPSNRPRANRKLGKPTTRPDDKTRAEQDAQEAANAAAKRSEERRVGKEWVSTGRSRWSPEH